MTRFFRHPCCTACILALSGCAGQLEGDRDDYRVDPSATPAVEVCDAAPILLSACGLSSCHAAEAPAAALDLASSGVAERLIGVPSTHPDCTHRALVDVDAVEGSFLLEKLGDTSPECGDRMPLVGTLEDAQLECITDWVLSFGEGDGGASVLVVGTDGGDGG